MSKFKAILCALAISGISLTVASHAQAQTSAPRAVANQAQSYFVEFGKSIASGLQVSKGDAIVITAKFRSDPGLFDPFAMPIAHTTDGQSGEVLSHVDPGVKRLDADTIQVSRFVAKRAGSAEIVLEFPGGKSTIVTVTVK